MWFLQNVLICIIIIFLAGENLWLFWTLRLSDEAFIMKGRNTLSSDIWRHTLYLNHLSYSTALFKSFNTFDATNHEQWFECRLVRIWRDIMHYLLSQEPFHWAKYWVQWGKIGIYVISSNFWMWSIKLYNNRARVQLIFLTCTK